MPYFPPPVTGGGGTVTAASIRAAHAADAAVYPTPPILQDYKVTGVAPKDFIKGAVPKPVGDPWSPAEIDAMSNAIDLMMASNERFKIGAPNAETRVGRTIRPALDEASADRTFRAMEFWGDIIADGSFTDYHTILGLDRSSGQQATVSFSGNFVVYPNHLKRVGDIVTFINNAGDVLPTPLLKTVPGAAVGASNPYYISSQSFAAGQFRLAATRGAAMAGTGSLTFSGGTPSGHRLAWGSLVGRSIDLDIVPVPTVEPRGIIDLGNTRYSRMTGNFKLTQALGAANKPNMYGLCTTGHLNRTVAGGGGGSVHSTRMQFGNMGCGIYVTPQYESANDYLADTITGTPIDTVYFDANVDIPFVFAGNSADGTAFGSMNIANPVGGTSYVSGSHVKINRLFITGRSLNDIPIRIKNGGVIIDEMYVEGQQAVEEDGQGNPIPCLDAVFEMQNNSTLDIRHYKQGGAKASTLAKGIVYDTSNNASVQIRCQEKTARPSWANPANRPYNIPAFATLRTVAGAHRFYDCYLPGVEVPSLSPGFNPYIFEAAGGVTLTNDQLISHTQTTETAKWTWSASARRKAVGSYGTPVIV